MLSNIQIIFLTIFVILAIPLLWLDWKYHMLPDILTKPLICIGLIINYFQTFVSFKDSFIGAFLGYFSLWTVFWCFKIVTGKDGLGYGDFKLLAAIGAWFGFSIIMPVLFFSSILGIFIALVTRTKTIAFGVPMLFTTIVWSCLC